MTTINQLNASDTFSLQDKLMIWDADAGATRSVTGAVLQEGIIPVVNSAIDSVLQWQRRTTDFTVTTQFGAFDVFPTSGDVTVTLPNPSAWSSGRVDIYNQTNNTNNVIVKDYLGATLFAIQPITAFSFYFDNEQGVAPWDSVKLDGSSVINLPVGTYGDFNAIAWASIPSGQYTVAGLGNQFSNLPTGTVLLPLSQYTYNIDHVNVSGDYYDNVFFSTTSDFSNNYLGRPCIRSGADFGSATSTGWRILGYKAEESFYLDAQNQSLGAIALPTSATTFIWPTIMTSYGDIGYDTSTGTVTINKTGVYTFNFTYNVVVPSGTRSVFSGAKIWNGTSFVPSRYSARAVSVRNNETGQAIFTSTNRFVAGTQIQFDTWCDNGVNIQAVTPVGGASGYTIPAARILITGVESQ